MKVSEFAKQADVIAAAAEAASKTIAETIATQVGMLVSDKMTPQDIKTLQVQVLTAAAGSDESGLLRKAFANPAPQRGLGAPPVPHE